MTESSCDARGRLQHLSCAPGPVRNGWTGHARCAQCAAPATCAPFVAPASPHHVARSWPLPTCANGQSARVLRGREDNCSEADTLEELEVKLLRVAPELLELNDGRDGQPVPFDLIARKRESAAFA